MEPEGGDRATECVHTRLGRKVRRPDPVACRISGDHDNRNAAGRRGDRECGAHDARIDRPALPPCRSISGDGVRETLREIARRIPLEIHEVPTGTAVFDWIVPKEWNIRDAYIRNARGEKIVDFRDSNLHIVGYSVPVNARLTLAELREHIFTLPDKPGWIPYRTSYFRESWGSACGTISSRLSLKGRMKQ